MDLDETHGPQHAITASDSTLSVQPAWRSIPLERQHLATGHSQIHGWQGDYRGAEFFTADSFVQELSQQSFKGNQGSLTEPVHQALSQFYEQSYAVHEDIASSQLAPSSEIGSSISNTSFSSGGSRLVSQTESLPGTKEVPVAGHVSNLKEIPNAGYLTSIQPQTMTVNLIVGIISVPPTRTIKTRRGDTVELLEILAGDETRTGFGINFWLSPSQSETADLAKVLGSLRPQDVVLIRNVALSSFRGKVFGQSLRKGLTKAHLLFRNRNDRSDLAGCYNAADLAPGVSSHPQTVKTSRVREWVLKFVGATYGGAGTQIKDQAKIMEEVLPPDTQ